MIRIGVLILVALFAEANVAAGIDADVRPLRRAIPLQDDGKAAPRLADIDVQLEVNEDPSQKSTGLVVKVTFINRGVEHVRLLNPKYTTSLLLLTEDGWPVEWPDERGFDILVNEGIIRRRPLTGQMVVIAPGGTHHVTLTVRDTYLIERRTRAEPPPLAAGEISSVAARPTYPLAAGTYRLTVQTKLIGGTRIDVNQSRRLISPAIVVRHGV